ncbi:Alpha/Beta hydrolase fold [Hyaloscypha variabilis]
MPYEYDPELKHVMGSMQAMKAQDLPVAVHDIATRRQNAGRLLAILGAIQLTEGVEKKSFKTNTADGHELEMVWYSPASVPATAGPALLHIHGGGMIVFDVHNFHPVLNNTVAASGVPMLSIDYRIAPEHPHPTLLEDCYTGLTWLRDHAKELNINPTRIGVTGESAGGGLAAGLALMARDRKFSPPLAKQVLVYPMLDDRTTVPDKELLPFLSYSYEDNFTGWSAYIGKDIIGTDKVSTYAAPARETDLSNLPSAYIDVGGLDIFMSEDMDYARRLAAARVSTEFHLYPGAPHGFEGWVPNAKVSKRAIESRIRAFKSF